MEPRVDPIAASFAQLQRAAGNKAVVSLLARDADKPDTTGKAPRWTIVLPDPIGVLPLESYSWNGSNEIAATVAGSGADPRLFETASNGTPLAVVKLSNPYLEITMTGVVITSLQVSSGHVELRLNAKTTEMKRPEEAKGKPA